MCLTQAEREQIQGAVEAAFAGPAPDSWAEWLEGRAVEFAQAAAGAPRPPDCPSPTPGQVVAFAYQLHPALVEAFLDLTEQVIRDAVWWIGCRLGVPGGGEANEWVPEELPSLRALLWRTLASETCECWGRWEALSLESQEYALSHCADHHRLRQWAGTERLWDFMFRALVSGALRLPDPAQGITAREYANGFRHGMLAKAVGDGSLRAGPALVCQVPGCNGEVEAGPHQDHCDACGQLSHVEETSWRLWFEGRRRPAWCRRCLPTRLPAGCNCLYFRQGGPCPGCGVEAWSPRPTRVWVRATSHSFTREVEDSGGGPPENEVIDRETRERLGQWVETVADARHRGVLRGLLLEGRTLDELADDLGLPRRGRDFERLAREAVELLPPGLLPARREETEAAEEEART